MPQEHPTDRQLAALVDGRLEDQEAAGLRVHVGDCPWCQMRIGSADEPISSSAARAFEPMDFESHIEEQAAAPATGDIWRLAWDDTTALAAVWEAAADTVAVMPIVDVIDADEWCAIFDAAVTSGLGDLAVSVTRAVDVPWSVLDARIGELVDLEPIAQLRDAFLGIVSQVNVLRGLPVLSELDDRADALAEIADVLDVLSHVRWAGDETDEPAPAVGYDVAFEAGLEPNRALAVGVRGATPTDAEADLIEAATGQRPAPPPVPVGLRRAIDQPRRKVAIRARALAARHSEAVERRRLAVAAEPALHAARGTHGQPPDYDLILDRILDE